MNTTNGGDSSSSSDKGLVTETKLEVMTDLASQKHALSERKRRKQINGHYNSLRQFFPRLLKSDKASVLAETVNHLKELKTIITNITSSQEDGDSRPSIFIPGENDEATVNYCNNGVQATICCDDRADLNQNLMEAIQSVGGKVVKAEIATVGGRTKVEVVVEWPECNRAKEDVLLLRRALKAVVENRIFGRTGFVGHVFTEPEFIGLGRKSDIYEKIETMLADGLVARSY
ncbi:putative transcription factor bHLH107 [Tanacetum coccineum]